MSFEKCNKFNLLKKIVKELGQESKSLDIENRILEHLVGILKNSNDACECIITLSSLNVNIEKIDQVVSAILSKLPKKDNERLRPGRVNAAIVAINNEQRLQKSLAFADILGFSRW